MKKIASRACAFAWVEMEIIMPQQLIRLSFFAMFIDNLPHLLSITKSPSCKLRIQASGACVCGAARNFNLHLLLHFFNFSFCTVWCVWTWRSHTADCCCRIIAQFPCTHANYAPCCEWVCLSRKKEIARLAWRPCQHFSFSLLPLREQFYCWCRCLRRRRRRVIMHYYLMCVFCKMKLRADCDEMGHRLIIAARPAPSSFCPH